MMKLLTATTLILMVLLTACKPEPAIAPVLTAEIVREATRTATVTPHKSPAPQVGTSIPTNVPPTATLTPLGPTPTLPLLAAARCVPSDKLRQTGQVIQVLDGNTIRVRLENGQEATVRYIGVEVGQLDTQAGYLAASENQALVEGKTITLAQGASDFSTDAPDMLMRYVFVGDEFVNLAMIERGYARARIEMPETACEGVLRQAEQAAFLNFDGLWGYKLGLSLTGTPTLLAMGADAQSSLFGGLVVPTPTRGSPTPVCHPAYPTVCIPPPPPYLNCGDITFRNFVVLFPDPHDLEGRNKNNIGCEKP